MEKKGCTVIGATAGFYSKVEGSPLSYKDTEDPGIPIIAEYTRFDSADRQNFCKERDIDRHLSTEIADSTLTEGLRAGGEKVTILTGNHCIYSSFFRRLSKIGRYEEYIYNCLLNEKIKYQELKKQAGLESWPIYHNLLVNDIVFLQEILLDSPIRSSLRLGELNFTPEGKPVIKESDLQVVQELDVNIALDWLISRQKVKLEKSGYRFEKISFDYQGNQVEKEVPVKNPELRYKYRTVEIPEGPKAVISYSDFDGSSLAEFQTYENGYAVFDENGKLTRIPEQERANHSSFENLKEAIARGETEGVPMILTSTRSIWECLYLLDQAESKKPPFLGSEDGNVLWIRDGLKPITINEFRREGYIVQELEDVSVIVQTQSLDEKLKGDDGNERTHIEAFREFSEA